jgi:hypothetical protein
MTHQAGRAGLLHQVRRLEDLRRRAEAEERAAGSLSDYLDHGRPNGREAQHALAEMEEHNRRAEIERRRLDELVADVRQGAPEAIAAWADAHRAVCTAIVAETAGRETEAEVRRYVAGEALAAWDRVSRGEQSYVRINVYYLSDYEDRLDAVLALAAG